MFPTTDMVEVKAGTEAINKEKKQQYGQQQRSVHLSQHLGNTRIIARTVILQHILLKHNTTKEVQKQKQNRSHFFLSFIFFAFWTMASTVNTFFFFSQIIDTNKDLTPFNRPKTLRTAKQFSGNDGKPRGSRNNHKVREKHRL